MSLPILPQQQRENPEPQEGSNPMPWFVIVLTALLMGFGVLYIARSAIVNVPALGDGRHHPQRASRWRRLRRWRWRLRTRRRGTRRRNYRWIRQWIRWRRGRDPLRRRFR